MCMHEKLDVDDDGVVKGCTGKASVWANHDAFHAYLLSDDYERYSQLRRLLVCLLLGHLSYKRG